jgi:hypothetical protein
VKLRTLMSSSIHRRSGLMGFSLIAGSCLEVGVLDPSILKTERPLRHPPLLNGSLPSIPYAPPPPPARAGSFTGRVEMWRGGCRLNISVAASFVRRCLSGSTMTPFPHPTHRTGQADFPHPALGQDFTPSLSRFRVQRLLRFLNTSGVDRLPNLQVLSPRIASVLN